MQYIAMIWNTEQPNDLLITVKIAGKVTFVLFSSVIKVTSYYIQFTVL